MKFRHAVAGGDEKVELQMVPMIDIVFQLLIFFVLTFKIAVPEGDFNITMPRNDSSEKPIEDRVELPIHVHLVADDNGKLTNIRVNQRESYGAGEAAFSKLRSFVIEEVNRGPASGLMSFREAGEVEFEVDPKLKYKNLIRAVTAVTGYTDDDDHIIRLVQKIKFMRPKKKKTAAP